MLHSLIRCSYAAVLTIDAASKETILDSFCRIGKSAGLEPTENAGRHFLSQIAKPWLLIIDNADDRLLDLRSVFPLGDAVHIIITTRCPDFRQMGNLGFLELGGLKEGEALQLLLSKAEIPKPWNKANQDAGNMINKALGYLALAIIQAGNCIFRKICNLEDYLSLHTAARNSSHSRRLSTTKANGDNDDIVHAVYSSFDVSLVILEKRSAIMYQDALDLLKIISFYHFEHIPKGLFTRAIDARAREITSPKTLSFIGRLARNLLKRLEPPRLLPRFLQLEDGRFDDRCKAL